jgi:hemerythrin superfamily protein
MNQDAIEPISVRDRYLADHHSFEVLFAKLLAAIDAQDQESTRSFWRDLDSSLLTHLEIEETHMVPALLRTSERDARVLLQEHAHIRRRLDEIGESIDSNLMRLEAIRDFLDELRAHTESEDRLLYPRE